MTNENLLIRQSLEALGKRVTQLEDELRNRGKGGFKWFK